ncbi:unnamed protein product [Heligmosomoides polygyrus]|uniref:Uncharacterized protein n=1 Tax=Heligmosomoides polygyrus TaxID=6339 RepID=A0A183FJ50_HELPZ|nr:unnamed protein product [Heligmosomoides polygyrus]
MDPPSSRETKGVISVVQGFHEEVRPTLGDGSRPVGVCEAHYVAGPPNFQRIGSCDSVSAFRMSTKLRTPEAFCHLRESRHSEHRHLGSQLCDADPAFVWLRS